MQRPKLHLRDLFWLVALAALGLGWYREHRALRNELREVKYDLLQARQSVFQTAFVGSYHRGLEVNRSQRPDLTEAEIDAALEMLGQWNQATNLSPYILVIP